MSTLLHPAIHSLHALKKEIRTRDKLQLIRTLKALHVLEHQMGYLLHLECQQREKDILQGLANDINQKFETLHKKLHHGYHTKWGNEWLEELKTFQSTFKTQTEHCKHELREKIHETIALQAKMRTIEIVRLFFGFLTIFGGIFLMVGLFMGFVVLITGAGIAPTSGSAHIRALIAAFVGGIITAIGVIGLLHSFKNYPVLRKIKFPRHAAKIDPASAYKELVSRLERFIPLLAHKQR